MRSQLFFLLLLSSPAAAQTAEMVAHEQIPTFRAETNLVTVPVVVRDSRGRPRGDLRREDFQLFDRGKLQIISRFSVETSGRPGGEAVPAGGVVPGKGLPAVNVPERFVAYLFDDVHMKLGESARVRAASMRQAVAALGPTDRVAVFTTSGETTLEFTNDRDRLHQTLGQLTPHPIGHTGEAECPNISYYLADLIINKEDTGALNVVMGDMASCGLGGPGAVQMAQAFARMALNAGERETRAALRALKDAVQRLSVMPGQRILVLISPGFHTPESRQEEHDILDRAIRAKVMINGLDVRGVYIDTAYDASSRTYSPEVARNKRQYDGLAASVQADVLEDLSNGSGGRLFRNNNDLDEQFKGSAAVPEYLYLLGFSPQNLKLDGSFHALKVTIKPPGSLSARRGYYAPNQLETAAATAKREIEESVFSRDEILDVPLELQTQFFKPAPDRARVTVVARVDVKRLHFRKEEGVNRNTLTVVTAVFDQMGKYVAGNEKIVELRMRDTTLEMESPPRFTGRAIFDLKPAAYLVRVVVRDAEGQQMSAVNGVVEIPLFD